MPKALVVVLVIATIHGTACADETDDALARQLAAIVRDPRQSAASRTDAARSLAQLGPKAAGILDELTRQLGLLRGAEMESLQQAVVGAIGAMGPSARSALPSLSRAAGRSIDLDLAIKDAKAQLLQDAAAFEVQTLSRQLLSRDAGRRLAAVKDLGQMGSAAAGALPALTKVLADADSDVRRAAVLAIRRVAPTAKPTRELIQALVKDLTDQDDTVRFVAVRALGKLGPDAAEAGAAIQKLLADPDKDIRKAAADALARFAGP